MDHNAADGEAGGLEAVGDVLGNGDTKELIADVLPVLQKNGVQIYFCGHDHVLQHLVHGGVNFFVCGGGASHRTVKERADVRFGAGCAGSLSMTLTAAAAQATYLSDKGIELYRTSIPAPRAEVRLFGRSTLNAEPPSRRGETGEGIGERY